MMDNSFIGSWKLLSAVYDRDGQLAYPFGTTPIGLLVYDAAGNMTVQIRHSSYGESAAKRESATDQKRASFDGYLGYFGTYQINEAENLIEHFVTGSTLPHWVGSVQRRLYQFDGNQLTLSTLATTDRKGALAVLVWERF